MALKAAWPQNILLLCPFHQLQALWQYLWARLRKIEKEDKAQMFKLVCKLVYNDTIVLFNAEECDMKSNQSYKEYGAFLAHIKEDSSLQKSLSTFGSVFRDAKWVVKGKKEIKSMYNLHLKEGELLQ